MNQSLARAAAREKIAGEIAQERWEGEDDVDILPGQWVISNSIEPVVETVDGGYWIRARVFVEADTVEKKMKILESTVTLIGNVPVYIEVNTDDRRVTQVVVDDEALEYEEDSNAEAKAIAEDDGTAWPSWQFGW